MGEIVANLLKVSAMTLAKGGEDGQSHGAMVYFASQPVEKIDRKKKRRIYFYSDLGSQHFQDISYDPRAAEAIYPEVNHCFFIFCPGWMRLVDSRNYFGFKHEWFNEENCIGSH